MELMDPSAFVALIFLSGTGFGWLLAKSRSASRPAWKSDLVGYQPLPSPTRPAPPMPHIEPTRPWPMQSLQARHVEAARASLGRLMNTEASTEDALSSAEFFITAARAEMKKPTTTTESEQ